MLQRRRKHTNVNMVEIGTNAKTMEEALFVSMVKRGAKAKTVKVLLFVSIISKGHPAKNVEAAVFMNIVEKGINANNVEASCICGPGRERSKCIDCGGSSICEHDKIRSRCPLCDPLGHLCHVIRCRVRQALKKKKKELFSQEYLGMTWENYGKVWHIDHKILLKYKKDGIPQTLEEV